MTIETKTAPPSGRRERKKAQLRQQIIDTAIGMFRERGYEATRIEDINESLDISRTTFFRYFPSKDAVLRDFVLDYRGAALTTALALDAPVADRLRGFYRALAEASRADPEIVRATMQSGIVNPVRTPSFLALYRGQLTQLIALLAEGQQCGELSKSFTALQLATYLESLNFSVVSMWAAGFLPTAALVGEVAAAVDFFLGRARS